jgi:hypothetical protein
MHMRGFMVGILFSGSMVAAGNRLAGTLVWPMSAEVQLPAFL